MSFPALCPGIIQDRARQLEIQKHSHFPAFFNRPTFLNISRWIWRTLSSLTAQMRFASTGCDSRLSNRSFRAPRRMSALFGGPFTLFIYTANVFNKSCSVNVQRHEQMFNSLPPNSDRALPGTARRSEISSECLDLLEQLLLFSHTLCGSYNRWHVLVFKWAPTSISCLFQTIILLLILLEFQSIKKIIFKHLKA